MPSMNKLSHIQLLVFPMSLLGGGFIGSQTTMFLSNLEILKGGYYTKGDIYIVGNVVLGLFYSLFSVILQEFI
jgi:hypothetical protein